MSTRPIFALLLLTSTLAFSPVSRLDAATINWSLTELVNTGGAQNTTGTGFLTSTFPGNLPVLTAAGVTQVHYAENYGGPAATLDGVPFDAGVFSLNAGGGNTASVFHANSGTNPVTATATWGNHTDGNGNGATLVVGSEIAAPLTVGQSYVIQLIAMDGRGNQAARSYTVDGIPTDHALGTSGVTWGNALLATGTFKADATTQSFMTQLGPRGDAQINAIVIRTIPEPSRALLVAIAGIGLCLRRQRSDTN